MFNSDEPGGQGEQGVVSDPQSETRPPREVLTVDNSNGIYDWPSTGGRRVSPDKTRSDLIHGTLDLLILRTLRDEPLHGWAISKRIGLVSGEILRVNQGSLYPALYRLEDRGWIRAEWGRAANGRRVKMYELTEAGDRQLTVERDLWKEFVTGVSRVLAEEPDGLEEA
jgi:PadR family transcriptional regulator PadR